jgi:nicotinamide riboside kinase
MKIINLFGSPGAGKSTAAMGLVHEMKKRYHAVEYVSEFAKDLFWSGNQHLMVQQNLVFAEQAWRQERLRQHGVEYAVTDSPLMLSSFYGEQYRKDLPKCFHDWVKHSFDQFDNVNFFIHRNHPYEAAGRIQNEHESDALAQDLLSFLKKNHLPLIELQAADVVPSQILSHLSLDWFNTPQPQ